mmetsp:Transcript_11054/g.32837  ORF Transcript_11054/g.32837 Transcript_11054/m.32837 type:complete len:513 (-) Transcript_11054:359-1897(-)
MVDAPVRDVEIPIDPAPKQLFFPWGRKVSAPGMGGRPWNPHQSTRWQCACAGFTCLAMMTLFIARITELGSADLLAWSRDSARALLEVTETANEARHSSLWKRRKSHVDVTLVTLTTADRIWMLGQLCQRWHGPVSAAVYSACEQRANVSEALRASSCGQATNFKVTHMCAENAGNDPSAFPVNALRNRARAGVTTSHWLLADVDMFPSIGAHHNLKAMLSSPWAKPSMTPGADKVAIVVPAFSAARTERPPHSLRGLLSCARRGRCFAFKGHPTAIPAHHLSTNYPRWARESKRVGPLCSASATPPYRIPCFDSILYEPYLVFPNTHATSTFDERFTGYGKNKVSFIHRARVLGFTFYVAPSVFLIHEPHVPSASFRNWSKSTHRNRMDRGFIDFMREVAALRSSNATPVCDKVLPQRVPVVLSNHTFHLATDQVAPALDDGRVDKPSTARMRMNAADLAELMLSDDEVDASPSFATDEGFPTLRHLVEHIRQGGFGKRRVVKQGEQAGRG